MRSFVHLYFIEIPLLISGPSLFSGVSILKVVEDWKLIILYWFLVIVAVAMPRIAVRPAWAKMMA